MDDRILLRIAVTKVADHGLHVCVVQQFNDLADAELIEVEIDGTARPLRVALRLGERSPLAPSEKDW